jgi:hypothetical protein
VYWLKEKTYHRTEEWSIKTGHRFPFSSSFLAMMINGELWELWGHPSHLHILYSTKSERAMMAVGGAGQTLSLCPENVNNGGASFPIFRFRVYAMFL